MRKLLVLLLKGRKRNFRTKENHFFVLMHSRRGRRKKPHREKQKIKISGFPIGIGFGFSPFLYFESASGTANVKKKNCAAPSFSSTLKATFKRIHSGMRDRLNRFQR
eukprot:TRINITY_DN16013_c0_g1_i1.p2 TRINITY_DN16013_c0_g1~~TRINITY_DN16013_c0_g1_i1.p2  ORF type:complete len:107 (+),score=4.50 TRINITY_DN16013_c0_g1_i1:155-475(+)